MNRNHALETTLERVGRILSRTYNINVRCRGNESPTVPAERWSAMG